MMKLLHVEPVPGYKLQLQYADGTAGEVDVSHLVGKGVFALWSDPAAFARLSLGSSGEVLWNDEVDLCADALYLELSGKQPKDLFPSLSGSPVHA
jgi:Protein of unknown function (DUF2442)